MTSLLRDHQGSPPENYEQLSDGGGSWGSDFDDPLTELYAQEIEDNMINENIEAELQQHFINQRPQNPVSENFKQVASVAGGSMDKTGTIPKTRFSYIHNARETGIKNQGRKEVRPDSCNGSEMPSDTFDRSIELVKTKNIKKYAKDARAFSYHCTAMPIDISNQFVENEMQQSFSSLTLENNQKKNPGKLRPEAFAFLKKFHQSTDSDFEKIQENVILERKQVLPTTLSIVSNDASPARFSNERNECTNNIPSAPPLENLPEKYESISHSSLSEENFDKRYFLPITDASEIGGEATKPPLPSRSPPPPLPSRPPRVFKYPPGTLFKPITNTQNIPAQNVSPPQRKVIFKPSVSKPVRQTFEHSKRAKETKINGNYPWTTMSNDFIGASASSSKSNKSASALIDSLSAEGMGQGEPLTLEDKISNYHSSMQHIQLDRPNLSKDETLMCMQNVKAVKKQPILPKPRKDSPPLSYKVPFDMRNRPLPPVPILDLPNEEIRSTEYFTFKTAQQSMLEKTELKRVQTPQNPPSSLSTRKPFICDLNEPLVSFDKKHLPKPPIPGPKPTSQQKLAQVISKQDCFSTDVSISQQKMTAASVPTASRFEEFSPRKNSAQANYKVQREGRKKSLGSNIEPTKAGSPHCQEIRGTLRKGRSSSGLSAGMDELHNSMVRPKLPQKIKGPQRSVSCSSLVQSLKDFNFSIWTAKEKKRKSVDTQISVGSKTKDDPSESDYLLPKVISPQISFNSSNTEDESQEPLVEKDFKASETRLSEYPWYHEVDGLVALERLSILREDGSFLVRPCSKPNKTFQHTMAILINERVLNLHIRKNVDSRYTLGCLKGEEKCFSSIPDLVIYYQRNPVDLQTERELQRRLFLKSTPPKESMLL